MHADCMVETWMYPTVSTFLDPWVFALRVRIDKPLISHVGQVSTSPERNFYSDKAIYLLAVWYMY